MLKITLLSITLSKSSKRKDEDTTSTEIILS